jgi:uncharacterized protein (TIGR02246 family)
MDIEVEIRELAREVDAAYDDGDAARMAGHWTADGLNVDPFGGRTEGRAGIEANLRHGLEGFMRGTRHELVVEHVVPLDEEVAVADGKATISGIVGPDGVAMGPQTSDFSMICVREDAGRWQIAQMRAYRFIPRQG